MTAQTAQWLAAVRSDAAELIESTDWAGTPLGPPATWPPPLRHAVTTCLSTPFPMAVCWGDDLTVVYNRGFERLLRTKSDWALGASVRTIMAEYWEVVRPVVERVVQQGESVWSADLSVMTSRSGPPREAHFMFAVSPLRDDDGAVAGILNVTAETTDHVVSGRRLALLSRLAAGLEPARQSATAVGATAVEALRAGPDIGAVDIYLLTGRRSQRLELIATTADGRGRTRPADELLREVIREVLATRTPRLVGRRLIAPLVASTNHAAPGVIVIEAAPRGPLDDDYRSFLGLVAATVGSAVAGADEQHREMDHLREINDALQQAMLPDPPGLPGWFTRYQPADGSLTVGGDWYDVVDLGADRWGLLVGDCVGHGLWAAALMGQLRAAGRALMLERNGPAATLDGLDRFAATLPGAEFSTVLCGLVNGRRGTLTLASAGHPPALLVGRRGSRWLDGSRGAPLTLGFGRRAERTTPLERGDVLLAYTDGLVERRDESLVVGLSRLAATAEALVRQAPIDTLADELIAMLAPVSRDDIALVAYQVAADGGPWPTRRPADHQVV